MDDRYYNHRTQMFEPERWLDAAPKDFNVWNVVKATCIAISVVSDRRPQGEYGDEPGYWHSPDWLRDFVWDRCRVLHLICQNEGFNENDWEQWLVWYSLDNYWAGRPVDDWYFRDDDPSDAHPHPLFRD